MSKESETGSRAKARLLGVARSTLFYEKKQEVKDWELKSCIEEVLRAHPSYGSRRVAIALKKNRKGVQRVMRTFGIKPYRRRGKKRHRLKEKYPLYPNLLMSMIPVHRHQVWVADFTHLKWEDKDIRVATVMDVYTREVVGLAVATTGGALLTIHALWSALLAHQHPHVFHSDNGVEYNARIFKEVLINFGIHISRSKPGCPWENGYQESFYDKFKVDLGDPHRFCSLGELVAEIYRTIHTYNTTRIHSALKMPPRVFAQLRAQDTMLAIVD